MEEFDKAWAAYPRKVAKGEARKAWAQTAKIRPPLEKILEAISVARKHWDDPMFIPHFATWLRAERWDDEYEVVVKKESKPSITCSECKQQAFTWMDGKCNPCWRKYMGLAA